MEKGKQLRNSKLSELKIGIADLLEEVRPEDLNKAISWSGREILSNPEVASQIEKLIKSDREFTQIVLGVASSIYMSIPAVPMDPGMLRQHIANVMPQYVANTLQSGLIMGIALVLELLNKKEDGTDQDENISQKNTTIQ